jgi:ATP-binding cassette, subfamily B, bacterial
MGENSIPGGRYPQTIRRAAALFWPYRGRLVLLALVVIVVSMLNVGTLLLIKPVFDQALFCPHDCPNLPLLFWLVGVMIAIPVVAGALEIARPYLATVLGQRVMQGLREALYAHLQRMPLRFFTETKTGEIQSRLANDIGGLQYVVTDVAALMLMTVMTLISTIGAMLLLSWQLTALSMALMPLFVWLTGRVGQARRAVGSSAQETMAEMLALSQETLSVSGVILSRSFGRGRQEIARFRALSVRLTELEVRQQMVGQGFFMALRLFFSVMPVLAYLVAGLVLAHGGIATQLSAGALIAFTTLQMQLLPPISGLLHMVVQVQASLALFDRVFAYLDLSCDIIDAPHAIDLPPGRIRGAISLRDVSFRYPASESSTPSNWALSGLTLDIEPGQFAAVVGTSGSGKTTLSYLLTRLYDVTEGAVYIDGHDIRQIRLDSLAAAIGMVTQETHLFHASIRENLRYGNPHATDTQLEAAARAAAIHDRILELDDGYDTLVGERGYRMSGGEKQRLAIARTILKDPKILILDEATSALDTVSEQLVLQALIPLMAGRTTVAIAHRLSTILAADVIFVLDRGRLVERGTHTELLKQGGTYVTLIHQSILGAARPYQVDDALRRAQAPGPAEPVSAPGWCLGSPGPHTARLAGNSRWSFRGLGQETSQQQERKDGKR